MRILTDDEVNLTAGDNAEDVVAGRGNQQSHQQANPNQNMRSGNNYYGGDNSQQWLIAQILDHGNQLLALTLRLDDLPNRFQRLKETVDIQVDKVDRLEKLEVVVRKEEVVIRPVPPPDSAILSTRTLLIFLLIAFLFLVVSVIYLIYLQAVANG